jgi:menaquinone-dependent protoporphyrinogen oxidase
MKVLVTAASKHGSTDGLARTIGAELELAGLDVDVRRPSEVASIDRYDALVIGSAVYLGRWLDEARQLVDGFAEELPTKRVWLFSSGPLGDPPKPAGDPLDVARLVERSGAVEHRVFAGRLDQERLGIAERVVIASVQGPSGDFRPWPAIQLWAREIAMSLRLDSAAAGPTDAGLVL